MSYWSKMLDPTYSNSTDSAAGFKRKLDEQTRGANENKTKYKGRFVCRIGANGMSNFGPALDDTFLASAIEGYDTQSPDLKPFIALVCVKEAGHPPFPIQRAPGDPEYMSFVKTLYENGGLFYKYDYNGQFTEPNYGDKVWVKYEDMQNNEGMGEFLGPELQGAIPAMGGGVGIAPSAFGDAGAAPSGGDSGGSSSPGRPKIPKSYFDKCKKKGKIKKTAKKEKEVKKEETDSSQDTAAELWNNLKEKAGEIANEVKSYSNEAFGTDFDVDVACKPFSKALGLSGIDVSLRYEHLPAARTPKKRKNPPISIVIHDTAGRGSSARKTFEVLYKKGLSSHYIITDSGKIYETADPGLDRCAHAGGGWNSYSIGIDMTCPVIVNDKLKKSKRWDSGKDPFSERIIPAPYYAYKNPDTKKQAVDYTEAQKKSLAKLVKALCEKYDIPKTGFKTFRPGGLSGSSFRGVVGHSQFNTNRVDGYNAVLILEERGIITLK